LSQRREWQMQAKPLGQACCSCYGLGKLASGLALGQAERTNGSLIYW
jgi:hypothetical protein